MSAANQEEDKLEGHPQVAILISDLFFQNKVAGTVRGLEHRPFLPALGEGPELATELSETEVVAAVVDLEDESFSAVPMLRQLRATETHCDLPVLAFCSHMNATATEDAQHLGCTTVPRSVLAGNLVKLLRELLVSADEAG